MKKKLMVIVLVAMALAGIVSAQGFQGPDSGPFEQPGEEPAYQDLLDRCYRFIKSLEAAQGDAHTILGSGSYAQAASILQTAIDNEALYLPAPFTGDYNPRTIEAIRVAKWISDEMKKNTVWLTSKLGKNMVDEIKFNTLNHAVYIAIRAYYDLDLKYYASIYVSCQGGCLYPNLPQAFREGMQRLGSMYMTYAQTTARSQGKTEVEMMLTKVVVNSAKNFLARNTGRLRLACVVTQLQDTENTIDQILYGHLKTLAAPSKESIVRSSVDQSAAQVRRVINGCY